MICLVNTRTWQLTNNATIPRVTPGLAVDVGEMLCVLALGRELFTASASYSSLARRSGQVPPIWFGPWFETWRVDYPGSLSTSVPASFGISAWSLFREVGCREFGLHCVIPALWGRASRYLYCIPCFVMCTSQWSWKASGFCRDGIVNLHFSCVQGKDTSLDMLPEFSFAIFNSSLADSRSLKSCLHLASLREFLPLGLYATICSLLDFILRVSHRFLVRVCHGLACVWFSPCCIDFSLLPCLLGFPVTAVGVWRVLAYLLQL